MKEVISLAHFFKESASEENAFLLLYKPGNEQSTCAYRNIKEAVAESNNVFYADVNEADDIHAKYKIYTVPALLIFKNNQLLNVIKGCNTKDFYNSVFLQLAVAKAAQDAVAQNKNQKNVKVYSTPTCTWCNTLKTWLNKNNVRYTEIDVSKDYNAAQEMLRLSGQQGVPQTYINGTMVVGFDQTKLKSLLDIK